MRRGVKSWLNRIRAAATVLAGRPVAYRIETLPDGRLRVGVPGSIVECRVGAGLLLGGGPPVIAGFVWNVRDGELVCGGR